MCTLTVAWGVFEDEPLVVAANRDELLDRPSTGPERYDGERRTVTPRDETAGGTWIGYNERGLFAGITNRWTGDERTADRSRGLLMRDVLDQPTAKAAVRLIEREVGARSYAGFNLLVADGFAGRPPTAFAESEEAGPVAGADDPAAAILVEYDGTLRTTTLDPGVHVVVNVGADGRYVIPDRRRDPAERQAANADRLRAHLQPEPGESPTAWRDRARAAIRDHDFGVCVHGDGFGTRSSSVLSFGEGGVAYEYADGPPCETEYERVTASVLD
jgi:hypothetical protein